MSQTLSGTSHTIRPYRAAGGTDRQGIREVFRLTGLFGDPVERYFPAPDFIADAMVEYYLRFEADWAFVAEDDASHRVVGYITGCPDTARRNLLSVTWAGPRLAAGFVRHGLLFRWAGLRIALRGLYEVMGLGREEGSTAADYDPRLYPAHLHMAVHPDYHRRGIGSGLLQALLAKLGAAGLSGLHLETTNRHSAAYALYQRHGFREVHRHRTRLFDHLVPASMLPIQEILMVKEL